MDLKKLATDNCADFEKAKTAASTAVNYAINIGERLLAAKEEFASVDEFSEWVSENHPFQYRAATRYIRIAVHKVQARVITNQHGDVGIMELQKMLPIVTEEPVENEADVSQMAYVGSLPGTIRGDADDWHTPSVFTDAARKVMGSIDLDPFSSVEANNEIDATKIFTLADDALGRSWAAPDTKTVWMNPPYSKGLSGKAVEKFLEEYDYGSFKEGIVLMNSSTDTYWFHRMANVCSAMCFTKGRIAFIGTGGKKSSGNTKGQVFFYFGGKSKRFAKEFADFGLVLGTGNI